MNGLNVLVVGVSALFESEGLCKRLRNAMCVCVCVCVCVHVCMYVCVFNLFCSWQAQTKTQISH